MSRITLAQAITAAAIATTMKRVAPTKNQAMP
jgi:hypothetical protein